MSGSDESRHGYADQILAVAAKDPALAALLAHQHECIEAMKAKVEQIPVIVRDALSEAANTLIKSRRATVMFWLQCVAAVGGAVAALIAIVHSIWPGHS